MELKKVLEAVHEIVREISAGRADVQFAECDCPKRTGQTKHSLTHLRRANELVQEKLPDNLIWHPENLSIEPKITLSIDDKGHVKCDLGSVEID